MPWYVPLLIFLARVCDVSIGTVRSMVVIAGYRWLSALLGFIEVTIWVLAVAGVIQYLHNPFAIVSYAGGFATGVFVGMTIEQRLALGLRMVRVIVPGEVSGLSHALRDAGYRATRVAGEGRDGPVEVVFTVIKRREMEALHAIVRAHCPQAFVSVERVDLAQAAVGDDSASTFARRPLTRISLVRK